MVVIRMYFDCFYKGYSYVSILMNIIYPNKWGNPMIDHIFDQFIWAFSLYLSNAYQITRHRTYLSMSSLNALISSFGATT